MKEMPAALSIVSVDAYDQNKMDIDSTKSIYEQYVFPRYAPRLTVELQVRCIQGCEQHRWDPRLAPHQSVWLIPGSLDKNDTAAAARAHLYWS